MPPRKKKASSPAPRRPRVKAPAVHESWFEAKPARGELAWLNMTAIGPDDGADRWSNVEDSLLTRDRHSSERSWKYFSK